MALSRRHWRPLLMAALAASLATAMAPAATLSSAASASLKTYWAPLSSPPALRPVPATATLPNMQRPRAVSLRMSRLRSPSVICQAFNPGSGPALQPSSSFLSILAQTNRPGSLPDDETHDAPDSEEIQEDEAADQVREGNTEKRSPYDLGPGFLPLVVKTDKPGIWKLVRRPDRIEDWPTVKDANDADFESNDEDGPEEIQEDGADESDEHEDSCDADHDGCESEEIQDDGAYEADIADDQVREENTKRGGYSFDFLPRLVKSDRPGYYKAVPRYDHEEDRPLRDDASDAGHEASDGRESEGAQQDCPGESSDAFVNGEKHEA